MDYLLCQNQQKNARDKQLYYNDQDIYLCQKKL